MRQITLGAVFVAAAGIGTSLLRASDDGVGTAGAHAGEIRALAVDRMNQDAIERLHREGWLEARGQLLSTVEFGMLYRQIGRAWTADSVATRYFAIPDLPEGLRSGLLSNPGGVLGPGDLIQSGRPQRTWERAAPIAYWIFTAQDASHAMAVHAN